jgi:hypothetical protein
LATVIPRTATSSVIASWTIAGPRPTGRSVPITISAAGPGSRPGTPWSPFGSIRWWFLGSWIGWRSR